MTKLEMLKRSRYSLNKNEIFNRKCWCRTAENSDSSLRKNNSYSWLGWTLHSSILPSILRVIHFFLRAGPGWNSSAQVVNLATSRAHAFEGEIWQGRTWPKPAAVDMVSGKGLLCSRTCWDVFVPREQILLMPFLSERNKKFLEACSYPYAHAPMHLTRGLAWWDIALHISTSFYKLSRQSSWQENLFKTLMFRMPWNLTYLYIYIYCLLSLYAKDQ